MTICCFVFGSVKCRVNSDSQLTNFSKRLGTTTKDVLAVKVLPSDAQLIDLWQSKGDRLKEQEISDQFDCRTVKQHFRLGV